MTPNVEEFKKLHVEMSDTFETMLGWSEALPKGLSSDTVFALGYAIGCLAKAKALLGRDIDQEESNAPHHNSPLPLRGRD